MSDPNAGEKATVTWDEPTIAEHDKERGTRMKIDEPKTPFELEQENDEGVRARLEELAKEDDGVRRRLEEMDLNKQISAGSSSSTGSGTVTGTIIPLLGDDEPSPPGQSGVRSGGPAPSVSAIPPNPSAPSTGPGGSSGGGPGGPPGAGAPLDLSAALGNNPDALAAALSSKLEEVQEDQEEKAKKQEEFDQKRKDHYNIGAQLKAMREQMAREEEEEDEDEDE